LEKRCAGKDGSGCRNGEYGAASKPGCVNAQL
jgi:hypothetical protein